MRNNIADTDTFCFTSCLGSRPKCAEHSIELFIALEILLIIFVESTELRIQFKHTHTYTYIYLYSTHLQIYLETRASQSLTGLSAGVNMRQKLTCFCMSHACDSH